MKIFFMSLLLTSASMATQIMCGGQVPVINNVTNIGLMSIDFSSAGNNVVIADFFINNNTPKWDLTITLINGGRFIQDDDDGITPNSLTIEIGNQRGVLGDRGPNGNVFAPTSLLNDAIFSWHYEQTTATINYNLSMVASWNKVDNVLAGLYTETAIATITASF